MFVMRKLLFIGILGIMFAEGAMALDAKDIANLKRNGVQDSTIINMVRTTKLSRPLTPQEVVFLNANGVSAPLLDFLTRPESSAIQPVSAPMASTPVSCPPPCPTPAPVVVESPTYVVSSPTYVVGPRYAYRPYYRPYYRSYSRPYNFGFYYGRGGGYRHYRGYRGGWGGGWGRW